MGCLSRVSFRSSSLLTRLPSALRQTMAWRLGPRIKMPSINAWPPMLVLKAQAVVSFLFDMAFFLFVYGLTGRRTVTSTPPSLWFSICSCPPWRETISSQTARPMPLPRSRLLPL